MLLKRIFLRSSYKSIKGKPLALFFKLRLNIEQFYQKEIVEWLLPVDGCHESVVRAAFELISSASVSDPLSLSYIYSCQKNCNGQF